MRSAYDDWKNDFSEMYDVETAVCDDEDDGLQLCEVCVARYLCDKIGHCINLEESKTATLEECLENV